MPSCRADINAGTSSLVQDARGNPELEANASANAGETGAAAQPVEQKVAEQPSRPSDSSSLTKDSIAPTAIPDNIQEDRIGIFGWTGFIVLTVANLGFLSLVASINVTVGAMCCLGWTFIIMIVALCLEQKGRMFMPFVNLLWIISCWLVFTVGVYVSVVIVGPAFEEENYLLAPVRSRTEDRELPRPPHQDNLAKLLPAGSPRELQEWAARDEKTSLPTFALLGNMTFFIGENREVGEILPDQRTLLYRSNGASLVPMEPRLWAPRHLVRVGSKLYFVADSDYTSGGLWSISEGNARHGNAELVAELKGSEMGELRGLFVDLGEWNIFVGDCPGRDIRQAVASNVRDCLEACESESGCRSVEITAKGSCWLKTIARCDALGSKVTSCPAGRSCFYTKPAAQYDPLGNRVCGSKEFSTATHFWDQQDTPSMSHPIGEALRSIYKRGHNDQVRAELDQECAALCSEDSSCGGYAVASDEYWMLPAYKCKLFADCESVYLDREKIPNGDFKGFRKVKGFPKLYLTAGYDCKNPFVHVRTIYRFDPSVPGAKLDNLMAYPCPGPLNWTASRSSGAPFGSKLPQVEPGYHLEGTPRALLWGVIFAAVLPMLLLSSCVLAFRQIPGVFVNLFFGVAILAAILYVLLAPSLRGIDVFIKYYLTIYSAMLWAGILVLTLFVEDPPEWFDGLLSWSVATVGVFFFFILHIDLQIPIVAESWRWWLYAMLCPFFAASAFIVDRLLPMLLGAIGMFIISWKSATVIVDVLGIVDHKIKMAAATGIFVVEAIGIIAIVLAYMVKRNYFECSADVVRGKEDARSFLAGGNSVDAVEPLRYAPMPEEKELSVSK